MSAITNSKDSLETTMAFATKDWGSDKNDAWIYGIIMGWDYAMPEIAKRFGWTDETVARLELLHNDFRGLS